MIDKSSKTENTNKLIRSFDSFFITSKDNLTSRSRICTCYVRQLEMRATRVVMRFAYSTYYSLPQKTRVFIRLPFING